MPLYGLSDNIIIFILDSRFTKYKMKYHWAVYSRAIYLKCPPKIDGFMKQTVLLHTIILQPVF